MAWSDNANAGLEREIVGPRRKSADPRTENLGPRNPYCKYLEVIMQV